MQIKSLMITGIRFSLVGLIATGIHISVFIFCIEIFNIQPLWSNLPAFVIASTAAFIGHFHWTFKTTEKSNPSAWQASFIKFVFTTLFGFCINMLIVFFIVNIQNMPYSYAIIFMATLTPGMLFVLNKQWAFR